MRVVLVALAALFPALGGPAGPALGQATPGQTRPAPTASPAPPIRNGGPSPAPPAVAAPAQPPPSLNPARDVAVTYRVSGAGPEAREMRVAWLAAAGLTRLEPPGAPGWILVERRPAGATGMRATMIVDSQRSFMRLPPEMATAMALDPPGGLALARGGEERIAGEPCTLWQAGPAGRRTALCVTADGVLLRSVTPLSSGGENLLEAVAVRYGPQDAARFRVPEGYRARQAPGPLVPPRR